jgi:hypothetical protein
LQQSVGQGRPLTDIGDKVATPLQSQRVFEPMREVWLDPKLERVEQKIEANLPV